LFFEGKNKEKVNRVCVQKAKSKKQKKQKIVIVVAVSLI
jgi:hypothetical protein